MKWNTKQTLRVYFQNFWLKLCRKNYAGHIVDSDISYSVLSWRPLFSIFTWQNICFNTILCCDHIVRRRYCQTKRYCSTILCWLKCCWHSLQNKFMMLQVYFRHTIMLIQIELTRISLTQLTVETLYCQLLTLIYFEHNLMLTQTLLTQLTRVSSLVAQRASLSFQLVNNALWQ